MIRQQDVGFYREKTIEALHKQLARISHMDDTLYDDKLAGEIPKDVYESKHRQFAEQTADVRERLVRLHEAQDIPPPVSLEVKSDSSLVRLYVASTPGQKRIIMANLFKRITANGDRICIEKAQ